MVADSVRFRRAVEDMLIHVVFTNSARATISLSVRPLAHFTLLTVSAACILTYSGEHVCII